MTVNYEVKLDLFSGPVDLLLYLVRKHEIDPLEIRLALITREFLEFIDVLEWIDLELASDFLVTASSLTEIKSRLALPVDEEPELETVDDQPQSQLIRQLLQYRRFKEAAERLEEHASDWRECYPRLSNDRPRRGKDPRNDRIKEVELWDLVSAFSRVVRRQAPDDTSMIRINEIPIGAYARQIRELLREQKQISFSSLFAGETARKRIVGLFLALLELIRHEGFRAQQPKLHGEIWIMPPETGVSDENLMASSEFDETSDSTAEQDDP